MATLDVLAACLADALRPLALNAQTDAGIRSLAAQLGWQLPSVPPSLRVLAGGLARLQKSLAEYAAASRAAEAGVPNAGVDAALGRVAVDLALLLGDLHALPARLRAELPPAFVNGTHIDRDFETYLYDWLLSQQLSRELPLTYGLLRVAGVLERRAGVSDDQLSPQSSDWRHIRWDRLFRLLDPAGLAGEVYGWGTPALDGEQLFRELVPLSFALGMPAERRHAHARGDTGSPLHPQLWIPLVQAADAQLFLVISVEPAPAGGLPGFGLTLVPSAAGNMTVPIGDALELLLEATAQVGTSAALVVRPNRAPTVLLDSDNAATPLSNGRVRAVLRWTAPDWHDGDAVAAGDGTRITLRRVTFALGAEAATAEASVYAELVVEDGRLIIAPPAGDGFLSSILPADGLHASFGFALQWSRDGVRFSGGGGLRTVLPLGTRIGGLQLHALEAGLDAKDGELSAELALGAALRFGPAELTVDRIGLKALARNTPGNLGPVDLAIAFKPPGGIGVSIDAGIVKGGGFLFTDPANRQYAGALELRIGNVGVKAIGLLNATPGAWSLLLFVYGQIPPIQLSFGFTLNGIGGMIGVRHGLDIPQLIAGMKTGAFDDILFPADPVGDAPRILNRLRTLFPVFARSLSLGPMFDIGWGTPRIIFIRIAILVQVDNVFGDQPVALARIVLAGQLRVLIGPTKEDANVTIVKLIVDILGFWDLDKKRYGFLARLRESKIAKIDITGGLAVFGEYGDKPRFLLAAGGFNPRFKDVPTEMGGGIDRLGAAFKVGRFNLTFTGYFAITPGTIQAGINFLATAKIGPVGLKGELGFDVIIYQDPYTHFIADFRIQAEVSYKGHTLAAVKVTGTVEGPGLWHIQGKVTFSILWWDISKSFDETWGSAPGVRTVQTNVQALLAGELGRRENWTAQLPAGTESMVTLAPHVGELATLAHPLGRFVFSQRVVPLGLTLERFGDDKVSGPTRFDISALTVSGVAAVRTPVREHFARAQYVETTEEEKLTRPSFEEMDAGVEFSAESFRVAATPVTTDMEYETAYLDVDPRRDNRIVRDVTLRRLALEHDLVQVLAAAGAAARAPQRVEEAARARVEKRIVLTPIALAVADRDTFAPDAAVPMTGQARTVEMIAEQRFKPADVARSQLIEEFELAGV